MERGDVVRVDKRISVSQKREKTGSSVEMWTDLESVIPSKSEREKQMSTIDAYMWNLESQLQRIYLQGSPRDTDVEKRFADTVREGEAVMNWEIRTDMHPPPCVKQIARGPLPYHAGSSAQ